MPWRASACWRWASADPVPGDVLAAIYQVTRGHPFYIYATSMRVIENVSLLHKPLTPATVQEAFTLETLGSTGRIYNLCRYVLEQSLQNVRGETMPQAVLQVLAQEPAGMTLTEIATRLKRPTGAIRQVMTWLVDVDLVEQRDDKTYQLPRSGFAGLGGLLLFRPAAHRHAQPEGLEQPGGRADGEI